MKCSTLLAFLVPALILAALALWTERRGGAWDRLGRSLAGQDRGAFIVPLDALSTNLSLSPEDTEAGPVLWALGPEAVLVFHTLAPMNVVLGLGYDNPVEDQSLTLTANGALLERIDHAPQTRGSHPGPGKHYVFRTRKGANTIRLGFRYWNHSGADFAAGDPRLLALRITRLTLLPAGLPGDAT